MTLLAVVCHNSTTHILRQRVVQCSL